MLLLAIESTTDATGKVDRAADRLASALEFLTLVSERVEVPPRLPQACMVALALTLGLRGIRITWRNSRDDFA